MKKTMKKIVLGALACAMMLSVSTVSFAKAAKEDKKPAVETKVTSQKVSKVTCTASGKVNVSFKGQVAYLPELSAVITDDKGVEIPCTIKKKNKALLTVAVKGLVKGEKYTIKVEGVKAKDAEVAATVEKTFIAKGMKTECKASKAKVEKKNVISVKLSKPATYKDATVTVVDEDGTAYDASIIKKAKGNIKVKVKGLVKGKTYTVTITGIKTKKEKNFSSISKKLVVK